MEQTKISQYNELNKKLAEWAVPSAIEVQVQERQIVIETDESTGCIELLTESLDACFKLLVPKAKQIIGKQEKTTTPIAYRKLFYLWVEQIIKSPYIVNIEPLALCLAIEKLIDGEKNNG